MLNQKRTGNDISRGLLVIGAIGLGIYLCNNSTNSTSRTDNDSSDCVEVYDAREGEGYIDCDLDYGEIYGYDDYDYREPPSDYDRDYRDEDYEYEDYDYDDYDSSDSQPYITTCTCQRNQYNCSDLSTQRNAQSCYDNCMREVGYDVHWLDDDGDGVACEVLP